ncbi:hypothetical protein ACLK18_14630 [Escherichia coli]
MNCLLAEHSQTITAMCADHAGKAVARRCTLLFSVLKRVLWLDKINVGIKPAFNLSTKCALFMPDAA